MTDAPVEPRGARPDLQAHCIERLLAGDVAVLQAVPRLCALC